MALAYQETPSHQYPSDDQIPKRSRWRLIRFQRVTREAVRTSLLDDLQGNSSVFINVSHGSNERNADGYRDRGYYG